MMRNTMIAIGVAALAAVAHPGLTAAQTSEAPQPIGTPAPQQTAAVPPTIARPSSRCAAQGEMAVLCTGVR